jgi:PEP-CTERM motif
MKISIASRTTLLLIAFAAVVLVPASAQVIYNDGPINGTTDAWTINFGFITSDTFTVSSGNSTLTGLSFGAWLFPGDILQSVQLTMTSEADGGTIYFNQVVSFTASGCSGNQFGFNVCTESGSFSGPTLLNGTYWLNLQNAIINDGDPVYWDENSGVGCTSPGCPSQAQQNGCLKGSDQPCIPPESFTLYGEPVGTVPEPSSVLLLGSGILGVVAVVRRRLL